MAEKESEISTESENVRVKLIAKNIRNKQRKWKGEGICPIAPI